MLGRRWDGGVQCLSDENTFNEGSNGLGLEIGDYTTDRTTDHEIAKIWFCTRFFIGLIFMP